jgi:Tetracyclin repressor-like, C-terminal domain
MRELPSTPHQIAWLEAGLACLRQSGLDEWEKISVILLLGHLVRAEAAMVSQVNALARAAGSTPRKAVADYGRLLERLTSSDRSPALHAAIGNGVFARETAPGSEFLFGLERVFDGIGLYIAGKSTGGT